MGATEYDITGLVARLPKLQHALLLYPERRHAIGLCF